MQRKRKRQQKQLEDRQKTLETFRLVTQDEARKRKRSSGASKMCTGEFFLPSSRGTAGCWQTSSWDHTEEILPAYWHMFRVKRAQTHHHKWLSNTSDLLSGPNTPLLPCCEASTTSSSQTCLFLYCRPCLLAHFMYSTYFILQPAFKDRNHLLWQVTSIHPWLLPPLPVPFLPQETDFSFNTKEPL